MPGSKRCDDAEDTEENTMKVVLFIPGVLGNLIVGVIGVFLGGWMFTTTF